VGKGTERLLDRTQVSPEEMERRWKETFGSEGVKGFDTSQSSQELDVHSGSTPDTSTTDDE
jgi:hypothetical protein